MIYVNNVSVYPSSITIKKGQFYSGAYAVVSPSNATCGCVEWTSDDIGVATVNSESGQIYGKSGGTARIYATATDGSGKSDYITVTVDDTVKITSIYTCPENMTLMVGDTETLSPVIYPSNATNKTLDWTTTNSSVASVSGGVVTAKAPGSAYIKATARDGSGKVGSTFVEVWGNVLVQSINVVPSSKTMNIGDSVILSANVTPSNATDSHVVWESTNPSVATVNAASGLVCAVGAGTATIKAEAQDGSGVVGTATITVRANVPVTGITVCPETKTLNVGESATLQATVYPYNATNKSVTWRSSNESVACVDRITGYMTALKAGTVTITATTSDGGYTDSADITVYIDTVTIKKDGNFNKVVFKNSGKVWRCINNDMIYNEENRENSDFIQRANYNYYPNYDSSNPTNMGVITYTDEELKLLYAIDPYGVAYYVERFANDKTGLTATLQEKDRIFKLFFGRNPKYFARNPDGSSWYQTGDTSDLSTVLSESETVFGMHQIWDAYTIRQMLELALTVFDIALSLTLVAPACYNWFKAHKTVNNVLKIISFVASGILDGFISPDLDSFAEDELEGTNLLWAYTIVTSYIDLYAVVQGMNLSANFYPQILDYYINNLNYKIKLELTSGQTYNLQEIKEALNND